MPRDGHPYIVGAGAARNRVLSRPAAAYPKTKSLSQSNNTCWGALALLFDLAFVFAKYLFDRGDGIFKTILATVDPL